MSPRSPGEIDRSNARYQGRIVCSFCNKTDAAVQKMVAGPNGVAICNDCIDVCNDIIGNESVSRPLPDEQEILGEPEMLSFKCPECGHHWAIDRK